MNKYLLKHSPAKRIALLQGPVGPFFALLREYLLENGAEKVIKVNYNGGDDYFYKDGDIIRYMRKSGDLEKFYRRLFLKNGIEAVYMFGDCRPVHKIAVKALKKLNINFYVFEEGYLRPNYITLEKGGVNGYSSLPRNPADIPDCDFDAPKAKNHIGYGKFRHMAFYAFLYFLAGRLARKRYARYEHHKPFHFCDARFWILSFLRKFIYQIIDKPVWKGLIRNHPKNYFFVPLQVYNDTQISEHSSYVDNTEFISEVIGSFAKHAPPEKLLVFKHHPMDRGHIRYGALIKQLAKEKGVSGRVRYLHEVNLPALLKYATGTIVINSTVGLSSLYHGTPVKVFGRAFYDMEGLTAQIPREAFWKTPGKVCEEIFIKYRNFIANKTQIRGSFYNKKFFKKIY